MSRQIATTTTFIRYQNVRKHLELCMKHSKLLDLLRSKIVSVPRSLKDQSRGALRIWAHQCECVFAQRLRRGQQMFSLYSRLWEERAFQDIIRKFRERIGARGRDFLVGALGVTGFDWNSHRISDHEIRKHQDELAYVHKLKEKTLCAKCEKSSRICQCDGKQSAPKVNSYDDWKVFIEKPDLVVWRRLHKSGCYEYKVFGSYDDVTAEDFLNVQIDIDYRRQWDKTAVVLNVIESDPDPKNNGDVIYWEMLWPKLFANRDYVFTRRFLVDHKTKTLYLVSKSTKHPSCPKEQTKYRIEDYWSYMVIRPYKDLNRKGIEFSLTYFDNPGVNIPASVTTWVAMKAMPEFCEKLREASKKYKSYCEAAGVCRICNVMDNTRVDDFSWPFFNEDVIIDNTVYEPQLTSLNYRTPEGGEGSDNHASKSQEGPVSPKPSEKDLEIVETKISTTDVSGGSNNVEADQSTTNSSSVQHEAEKHSFWSFRWDKIQSLMKKLTFNKLF